MPRFKLLIEYAGTRYSGWQIQKNAKTVQGEIERAVRAVSRRTDFELYGSGRTDAGVHALAQVAHLELYTTLAPELLRRQINDALPADIHIRAVDKAPHRFHARHDARSRSYLYQISTRRTAFAKPFVWWIREPLDLDVMRELAVCFVGMKNFAAFTDDDPDEKSTKVLLEQITLAEADALILIRLQGSHFLWKMVRRIVGVMAAVGKGDVTIADARRLVEDGEAAGGPRRGGAGTSPAALTAPAAGLFLEGVYYAGDAGPGPIRPVVCIARP
jgi:tRNA pseudouridine38-40 synthase